MNETIQCNKQNWCKHLLRLSMTALKYRLNGQSRGLGRLKKLWVFEKV